MSSPEYQREWRKRHIEKTREYERKRSNNPIRRKMMRESNRKSYRLHRQKRIELTQKYKQAHKQPCCGCKKLIRVKSAMMCLECHSFSAAMLGPWAPMADKIHLLTGPLFQLKENYQCLQESRRKLKELSEQYREMGNLPLTTALELLRETVSALPAIC